MLYIVPLFVAPTAEASTEREYWHHCNASVWSLLPVLVPPAEHLEACPVEITALPRPWSGDRQPSPSLLSGL